MNKIKVGSAASPNIKEVKSKIGSLSQASTYKPSGGNVKIESKKLAWKAESKIGSLGNVTHVPGGGAVKASCSFIYYHPSVPFRVIDVTGDSSWRCALG